MSLIQDLIKFKCQTHCGFHGQVLQALVQFKVGTETGEFCVRKFFKWNFLEDPDYVP